MQVTSEQVRGNLIGRVIGGGKYRILAVLGRGGMATVYRAQQLNVPRQVAIKVADPQISHQPVFVERFRREVAAVAQLGFEPHILPVYDMGQDMGMLYMVMPLISGGTLKDRMQEKSGEPWAAQQALDVSSQALAALGYAHERGFVHRDVKPSNMMFEGQRLYLADFGIAKAIEESGGSSSLAQTLTGNALVGTPAYMAPEQVLGAAVDSRTDLYAFGVVLYELLTGRVPFGGDTPLQVAFRHVQGTMPSPREANPQLSPALETVVLKALSKEPPGRYASAAEFLSALTAAVANPESTSPPPVVKAPAVNGADATAVAPRPAASPIPIPRFYVKVTRRHAIAAGALVAGAVAADRLLLRRWPWETDVLSSMAVGRSFFTATALPDGTILVVAGQRDNATYVATAERYDPVLNAWNAAGQVGAPRLGHIATLLPSGQVLIAGGQLTENPPQFTAEAYRYDAASNTWTQDGDMTDARLLHQAVRLADGRILVTGGFGATGYLTSAEVFDAQAGRWSRVQPMSVARVAHAAAPLPDGGVLVVGGASDGTTYAASAERYDPASDRWSQAGVMATPRAWHSATPLDDGRVLVAGGYFKQGANTTFVGTAEIYDPNTNAWSAAGVMAQARTAHTATPLGDGKILIAGGQSTSVLTSADRYDPATNTWSRGGQMTVARTQHQAVQFAEGQVLAIGGQTTFADSGATATVERFDPGRDRWTSAAHS
jgi:N-acetylneuraminic acid mutarotase